MLRLVKRKLDFTYKKKIGFRIKNITRDKDSYFIIIKGSVPQEDITGAYYSIWSLVLCSCRLLLWRGSFFLFACTLNKRFLGTVSVPDSET